MAETKAPASVAIVPKNYISNPFELIQPSLRSLGVNISAVLYTLLFLVLVVVATIVAAGVVIAIGATTSWVTAGILGAVLLLALMVLGVVLAPLVAILMLSGARGQQVGFKEALGRCWKYAWRVFLVSILTALAVIGGLILFIIPGLIFAAWFSLSIYALIDDDLRPVAAMKRSKQLVKQHVWETWGLYSLPHMFEAIPALGGAVAGVFNILMLGSPAVRYLQLKELKVDTKTVKPPIHWLNYVVIVLALLGGSLGGYYSANNSHNNTPNEIHYGNSTYDY